MEETKNEPLLDYIYKSKGDISFNKQKHCDESMTSLGDETIPPNSLRTTFFT